MSAANLKTRLAEKKNNLHSEPPKNTAVATKESALTTTTSEYTALTTNALEIISENLKKQPLSHALFDVIKSPSGGTTSFTVPGLSGDEMHKELTGIILDYTTPRAYWDTPDPVEGTPPNCYSTDSLVSHEGKPCSRCPFNDFGSKGNGDTNAKACKESVELFLLRPDNILPLIVRVPVTSKLLFLKYTTRLVSNLTPICGVVTRITLEKATNKTGQPYALFSFEVVNTLRPEETAAARSFGQKFMETLRIDDPPAPDIRDAG